MEKEGRDSWCIRSIQIVKQRLIGLHKVFQRRERVFLLGNGALSCSFSVKMISEILPEDKRRLHELEEQVAQLESGPPTVNVYDVQMGLEDMSKRLVELDALVLNEPKSRRDDYRRRVSHLKATYEHIKKAFDAVAKRSGANLALRGQRAELFAGSNTEYQEYPNFDIESAEAGSLSSSSRMVNDYIAVGQETLAELHSQRDRIKGLQKKVFDMFNYLGLSNGLMKAVTDRENVDKYIVLTGAAFVSMVVVLLLYYH